MPHRFDATPLLRKIATGDDEALRTLYREYGSLAYALAYRMLGRRERAEDVVQEAFLRVWRHAGRFDGARASFPTWLTRIVRNLCIDELRRKDPSQSADVLDDVEQWVAHASPIDRPILDRLIIREAFLALPMEQSRVVEMAYFEGLTHREIARNLGIPEGTVKSRLRLGLQRLRQVLTRESVG